MEIVICKTKEEASRRAADLVAACVKGNPKAVLGLATGSTPVGMYKCLIDDNKAKKISFKTVRSWNLDEYWGLAGTHDQSYRYFMDKNLFDSIDIVKKKGTITFRPFSHWFLGSFGLIHIAVSPMMVSGRVVATTA